MNDEPQPEKNNSDLPEDPKVAAGRVGGAGPGSSSPPKKIVKNQSSQQWIIAAVVGLAVVGFIIYAVLSFQQQVDAIRKDGVVVEKIFVPMPETQITIGEGGVEREEIPGNYYLKVRLEKNGAIENRFVDPATYHRYEIGDPIELFPARKHEWELAQEEVNRQKQAGELDAEEETATLPDPPVPAE